MIWLDLFLLRVFSRSNRYTEICHILPSTTKQMFPQNT